jgi:SAM-dependent methyltransferase
VEVRSGARPGTSPDNWIDFWDSDHSIYVNARHRDVHYRKIACDLRRHIPPGARVLDYGCGEALHAGLIAETAQALTLCEAAPLVRGALARRFAPHARIEVCSPEEVSALPSGSFDVIAMHSVAQYLAPKELDWLLADFHRLLRGEGLLIVGDVIPPHVTAATDAMALLKFAAANGFLPAALIGLARTLASNYWRLRSRLGLTRYAQSAMIAKLADAGFSASRAAANVGHNPARMTWLGRRM